MRRTRSTVTAVIIASTMLASAACTGGSSSEPSTNAAPITTPSTHTPTPKPKPKSKPEPKVNPYTGFGPVPQRSTIAVKIDDTAPGRPQVAINKADIVYIEAVEGGLTRLAAIFGTYHPK